MASEITMAPSTAKDDKAAKLATALRNNLRRRKGAKKNKAKEE